MVKGESKELSEKEQILLGAYADNECSLISRLVAARLIRKKPEARVFINQLKRASEAYRSSAMANSTEVDLWDRISHRIDAEERAALYLGARETLSERSEGSLVAGWLSRHALFGGLSGAAVAAMVLVLVTRPTKPGEILPVYSGGPVAAQNSPFQQASLGTEPRSVANSSMEVDWMRGNGSLRLIPNPNGKSAIIWVRKRNGLGGLRPTHLHPTPTIQALMEEGIDAKPLGTAK
jgi:hypothetical protein